MARRGARAGVPVRHGAGVAHASNAAEAAAILCEVQRLHITVPWANEADGTAPSLGAAAKEVSVLAVELINLLGAATVAKSGADLRSAGFRPPSDLWRDVCSLDKAAAFLRHPGAARDVVRQAREWIASLDRAVEVKPAGEESAADKASEEEHPAKETAAAAHVAAVNAAKEDIASRERTAAEHSAADNQPAVATRATPVSVADVATQAAPVVAHVGVVTSKPLRCSTAAGPDLELDVHGGGEYDAGLSYDPAVDDYDFLAVRARMAADLEVWYGASVDGLMDLPLPMLSSAHSVLGVAIEASNSAAYRRPWTRGPPISALPLRRPFRARRLRHLRPPKVVTRSHCRVLAPSSPFPVGPVFVAMSVTV